jgi:hypothetical protein
LSELVALAALVELDLQWLAVQEPMAETVWVWLGTSQSPTTARLLAAAVAAAAVAASTLGIGTAAAVVGAEHPTELEGLMERGLALALAEPLTALPRHSLRAAMAARH